MYKSEDVVRDEAQKILGFYDSSEADSGVGQLTTFKMLDDKYFKGINDKPDGWYLPKDTNKTAIILEVKAGGKDIEKEKEQLFKYLNIVRKKYAKSLGILYNGEDVLVYNDNFQQIREVKDNLLHKDYYISLVNRIPIDIDSIQNATIAINEILHYKFIMQDLRHRMIFTACALVAHKKGAKLENFKNLSFPYLKGKL